MSLRPADGPMTPSSRSVLGFLWQSEEPFSDDVSLDLAGAARDSHASRIEERPAGLIVVHRFGPTERYLKLVCRRREFGVLKFGGRSHRWLVPYAPKERSQSVARSDDRRQPVLDDCASIGIKRR